MSRTRGRGRWVRHSVDCILSAPLFAPSIFRSPEIFISRPLRLELVASFFLFDPRTPTGASVGGASVVSCVAVGAMSGAPMSARGSVEPTARASRARRRARGSRRPRASWAVARKPRGAVPEGGARGVRGRARADAACGTRVRVRRGAVPRRVRAHAQRVLRRQAGGHDPVRGARSTLDASPAPRLGRSLSETRASNVAERCSIARARPPPRVARHPVRHASLTPRASPRPLFPPPSRSTSCPTRPPPVSVPAPPRARGRGRTIRRRRLLATRATSARRDEIFSPPCATRFRLRDVFDAPGTRASTTGARAIGWRRRCSARTSPRIRAPATPRARSWRGPRLPPTRPRGSGASAWWPSSTSSKARAATGSTTTTDDPARRRRAVRPTFVLELARAGRGLGSATDSCSRSASRRRGGAVAAAKRGAARVRSTRRRSFSPQDQDPGESAADPTGDPEAWVRDGREMDVIAVRARVRSRGEGATRAFDDEDERGRRRETEKDAADEKGEEQEAARRDPVRKPRSKRRRTERGEDDDEATENSARATSLCRNRRCSARAGRVHKPSNRSARDGGAAGSVLAGVGSLARMALPRAAGLSAARTRSAL